MSKQIQAIRGMNDCLPQDTPVWQYVEQVLRQTVASYGYSEIRFPIVEMTELFKRSIGEVTDIVEKEMYTFADRNGDNLTLRPEGTACCVRAGNEHGLLYNQEQRLWYTGPMFRHERPQKGRYRQFHQFGLEAFGIASADIDAEVIVLTARLWQKLGLTPFVKLELNSLGSNAARAAYRDLLVAYLEQHKELLDEDSQRRLYSNPLRVLDSKNPAMAEMLAKAPQLLDHLDEQSAAHLAGLKQRLTAAGISFEINPRLVRGLDYYNRTVFEWVTTKLGAQGTIAGGGRYDGLLADLGGIHQHHPRRLQLPHLVDRIFRRYAAVDMEPAGQGGGLQLVRQIGAGTVVPHHGIAHGQHEIAAHQRLLTIRYIWGSL